MPWVLATASGLLAFLAYPPVGAWPLIFVAYVPLLLALDGAGPKRRFLLGLVCGTVFNLGMQYWIAGTLVTMSGLSWFVASPAVLLYVTYAGLQWAIFALGYAPLRRWSGRAWMLIVPLWFVLLERVFPVVFPFSASSALYPVPELVQLAVATGISGPAALVFVMTCAMTRGIELKRWPFGRSALAVALVWFVVAVYGNLYLDVVVNAAHRAGRATIRITLVQPNVTTDEKKAQDPAVRVGVYERTAQMTRDAMGAKPDLVVWPEGGFPFEFDIDAESRPKTGQETYALHFSRKLYELARDLNVHFVVGSLRSTPEGRTRNSVVHFAPGAARPEVYDKQLLLMFGEHVPLSETFPSLKKIPGTSDLEPGTEFKNFEVKRVGFVPNLCYEAIYSGFTREGLEAVYGDVILNLTNDVWFGDTPEPRHHLMLQTQRAIENRVWLVRSTNSGISAFVDPAGQIVAETRVGEQTVLTREIGIGEMGPSVYRQHGDLLMHLAGLLALVWLLVNNRAALGNFWRRRIVGRPGEVQP